MFSSVACKNLLISRLLQDFLKESIELSVTSVVQSVLESALFPITTIGTNCGSSLSSIELLNMALLSVRTSSSNTTLPTLVEKVYN